MSECLYIRSFVDEFSSTDQIAGLHELIVSLFVCLITEIQCWDNLKNKIYTHEIAIRNYSQQPKMVKWLFHLASKNQIINK